MAGRASVELYTLVFFADRTAVTDARVVKVKETSIVVFVPKYGIEGIVWLAAKGDTSSFTLDLAKQTVAAVDGSASYAMFDTVRVSFSPSLVGTVLVNAWKEPQHT
jgi:exosome complex exonuclease DIS3/RRP44